MTVIFDQSARGQFAANYPETPHKLPHGLRDHPLLTLESLAKLSERLPHASVEYNKGDLPTGVDPDSDIANGLSIGDTIRNVDTCRSWAVLKNIEQDDAYRALLLSLLGELQPLIEAKTGAMLRPQGYVFVSSPDAVTPYHFDPEHNILLQLRGSKTMVQFPAGDPFYAPDETHEGYHTGGPRNLVWRDELAAGGTAWHLSPGEGLFVPVMAPHHVKNGSEPSISLSITWRSDWSFAEADARAFNSVLRKVGLRPRAPGRFPAQNGAKATAWRVMRKLGVNS
jgi:hypothetical protein